jgi:multisubunit Na+/H+ antiporter MnhG subunit
MELILLAVFILLTNPLSSSVIGRATHKISAPTLKNLKLDEFKEFNEGNS